MILIKWHCSTILDMLNQLMAIKEGRGNRFAIEALLDTSDYQFEFQRYQNRVTRMDYLQYLLDCPNQTEESLNNPDLKAHHQYYRWALEHLDELMRQAIELNKQLNETFFLEAETKALKGLPKQLKQINLDFYFTLGIGQSFGYPFCNGSHYDFLILSKEFDMTALQTIMAHEIHHIYYKNWVEKNEIEKKLTAKQRFLLSFAGEGLAVKYTNNAYTILTDPICHEWINEGLDEMSWQYLTACFDEEFQRFREDYYHASLWDEKTWEQKIASYFNCHTVNQEKQEVPLLKQSMNYYLGASLYGVIHDAYGKEAVYALLKNMNKFESMYHDALRIRKKGKQYYL